MQDESALASRSGMLFDRELVSADPDWVLRPVRAVSRYGRSRPVSADLRTATVAELLAAAAEGNRAAWNRLVERFAGLVWDVALRAGIAPADAADVSQTTWLRLLENLTRIENPDALPGWLATTARREAYRVSRRNQHQRHAAREVDLRDPYLPPADERLLGDERKQELRRAFELLPERCRRLLALLVADPKVPYKEISVTLSMPQGSIGPNRRTCLDQLRRLLDQAPS